MMHVMFMHWDGAHAMQGTAERSGKKWLLHAVFFFFFFFFFWEGWIFITQVQR